MAVYNGAEHLPGFFERIDRQARADMELVVVDDGSTDGSAGLITDLVDRSPWTTRVVFLPENRGVGVARRAGFEAARGDHLLCADIDDILLPDALGHVVDALHRYGPDAVLVFDRFTRTGGTATLDRGMSTDEIRRPRQALEALLLGEISPFLWDKVIPRRGLAPEDLSAHRAGEDLLTLASVFRVHPHVRHVPVPLVSYMVRTNSLSLTGDLIAFTSPVTGQLAELRRLLERFGDTSDLVEVVQRRYAPRVLGRAAVAAARRDNLQYRRVRENVIAQMPPKEMALGMVFGDRRWCATMMLLRIPPAFRALSRRMGYGATLSQTELGGGRGRVAAEERPRSAPPETVGRVAVLWSMPSLYLDDCLSALSQEAEVRTWYSGAAGPIRTGTSGESLADWIRHDAGVVMVGGWRTREYLGLAWRARRRGAATVLAFDTQPPEGPFARLQCAVAGVVLRQVFTNVFVPGRRQFEMARRLGFQPFQIRDGLLACRQFADVAELPAEAPAFFWAGRLVDDKGVDVLLEGYRLYRAKVENPWPLRIVGEGPLRSVLEPPPVEGVQYLGSVPGEQVHVLMERSACLVSSSRYEPWGMVLAEAAAHARPIIATDAAGAADHLVLHGESGFVVPRDDPDALARALEAVHHLTAEQRAQMGRRACELGRQFTPDRWPEVISEFGGASPALVVAST